MEKIDIADYLALTRRPVRYIDREVNSIRKERSKVRLRFALCFPDAYEVGMSHLGIQILYHVLNSREDIVCERAFAPWKDFEALLREKGEPLATLESRIPLRENDIVGFSLQYELSYTNVLNMLDLGGITLQASERADCEPIVIGGGPGAFNPEPVAAFFDCFLLGDGEEAVIEICDVVMEGRERGLSRREVLENLSKVEGVYVPSFFRVTYNPDGTVEGIEPLVRGYRWVKKRVLSDINKVPLPESPVVPYMQTVHDRLSVEIARGCTRGCRFCQAGMIYRPLREREPGSILEYIRRTLKNTGYEEVSLLSLSTGDYSDIEGLLCSVMDELSGRRVAVSLPSLRVGTLGAGLADEIKKVRKTGFTLAPEAGTERLRDVINKGIEEDALIKGAREIFSLGWRAIKLYFMLGLPTETEEDLMEIIHLSRKVLDAGRTAGCRNAQVNVSVAAFVPKPFTPFQWEPQISLEESRRRLSLLRRGAKKRRLGFKWHDPAMSELEGVFSRGDRRLSGVILRAYEKGCRFDGWSEEFQWDLWQEAFREEGISMAFYTERRRGEEEVLPWDHLDCGVKKDFLWDDYKRSLAGGLTPDCRSSRCTDCGVCDHRLVKNMVFTGQKTVRRAGGARRLPRTGLRPLRVRFNFSKTGDLRYLSHLELSRTVARAVRRASLPVRYSGGFHPLPRIVFATPLPVGMESLDEYMDMELEPVGQYTTDGLASRLDSALPEGLKVKAARFIPLKLPPLSVIMKAQKYLVFLKNGPLGLDIEPRRIDGVIRDFSNNDSIDLEIERAGKKKHIDVKPLVEELTLKDDLVLGLTLRQGEGAGVKPHEVVAHLLNLPANKASLIPILKTKTVLENA